MKLEYKNKRTAVNRQAIAPLNVKNKGVFDYISELYEMQNNQEIDKMQLKLVERLWGEGKDE